MEPTSTPAPRPCERVLVVDGDRDMLQSMRDVLEMGGASVRTAETPREARRLLDSGFDPSVIVIEVRLGRDRGDEFVRQVRADPRHSHTPVVLMSGDIHTLRRLEDCASATIEKPFDMDHLYEVLSEMCSAA